MKSEKIRRKQQPKPVVVQREEKQEEVLVQKQQHPKKEVVLNVAKDRYSFEEFTAEEFERLVKLKGKDKK